MKQICKKQTKEKKKARSSERERRQKEEENRILICVLATMFLFLTVGLISNAFSPYLPYIQDKFGFTNTQISMIGTVRSVVSVLALTQADRFYKKAGLQKGMALILGCTAAAFFFLSRSDQPEQFYAAAVLLGIGYGLGGMLPASLLIRQRLRGREAVVLGITAAGSSLASIIGPIFVNRMTEAGGLSASFGVEAVFVAAGALTFYLAIGKKKGRDVSTDGHEENTLNDRQQKRETTAALEKESDVQKRTVSFGRECALAAAAIFMIGALGQSSFDHIPMFYSSQGKAAAFIAAMLSFQGIVQIVGKCAFGAVAERTGSAGASRIFLLFLAIGQGLLLTAPFSGKLLSVTAMFFVGIGLSLASVGITVWASDFSDRESYPLVLKRFQMAYVTGGMVFSPVPGLIADRMGSYMDAYLMFFGFSVAAAAILFGIYKRRADSSCSLQRTA